MARSSPPPYFVGSIYVARGGRPIFLGPYDPTAGAAQACLEAVRERCPNSAVVQLGEEGRPGSIFRSHIEVKLDTLGDELGIVLDLCALAFPLLLLA